MNKILKSFIFCFLILFISGCGSKPLNVTISQVENDLKEILKENYSVDLISNITIESSNLTKEEKDLLSKKYLGDIEYDKITVSFLLKSIDVDVFAYYDLLYVKLNEKMELAFFKPIKEEEWKYTSKQFVDESQILKDLKNEEFIGFPKGFIGSNEVTLVKIKNRKFFEDKSKEELDIVIEVKTIYGKVKIEAKIDYLFNKGIWVVQDFQVEDTKNWQILFNEKEPIPLDKQEIINVITNKNDILVYIANKDIVRSILVDESSIIPNDNGVTFCYLITLSYGEMGNVYYELFIEYDFIDNNWNFKKMQPKYLKENLEGLLGKWYNNDVSFVLKEKENSKIKLEFKDKNSQTYLLNFNIVYDFNLNEWYLKSENKYKNQTIEFLIDFKEKTLIHLNERFIK